MEYRSSYNIHLQSLGSTVGILSAAVRVGVEVSRMAGFNRDPRGLLCPDHSGDKVF